MDSFFEERKQCCSPPFPIDNHRFCFAVDATYCGACSRWVSKQIEGLAREDRHPKGCVDCLMDADHCACGHTSKAHNKSISLNDFAGMSEDEMEQMIIKLQNGPHKCNDCDCKLWEPVL